MVQLFLDIETIPADESLRVNIEQKILKLRNLKGGTEKYARQKKTIRENVDKIFRQTALNGNMGKILCIGYCKEPPIDSKTDILIGDEKNILSEFWDVSRNVDLFIGRNIMNFDLKFICRRSNVLGVKSSRNFRFTSYDRTLICDTMREWNSTRWTSLDALAQSMGFKSSKGELCGGKVYDFYKAGKQREIYEYCEADVELTRKIYKKMISQNDISKRN